MTGGHVQYADWDAAYAIGALTAGERREFESHLEGCASCRQAISELASTVALLPRISAEDARRLGEEQAPSDAHADAAVAAGLAVLDRARRRRRRRTRWVAAVAAAALVAGGVAVPVTIAVVSAPVAAFALQDVANVPLVASVRLRAADWGTRIELDCRYPAGPAGYARRYSLAVVDGRGTATTVSTWSAGPGTDARLSAATATPVGDIRAIEIRSDAGTVLMQHTLKR
jgi:hypothetical protein